jgi:hypothetical protein
MPDTIPVRSSRIEVRNPLLALPSSKLIMALPPESKKALDTLLRDLAIDAAAKAETCWKKSKGPMAVYWKAVSVYAKHTRKLVRV